MSAQQKSHPSRSPSSVPIPSLHTMKDISSSKNVRTTVYPRKKPSPHGISKSRAQNNSPLRYSSHSNTRTSSRNTKAEQHARKQREAQVSALRREGIYLEEEYREEIQRYMLEMEVRIFLLPFKNMPLKSLFFFLAIYHVFRSIHGSTTRDSVAYATLSRRFPRRDPLHFPSPP